MVNNIPPNPQNGTESTLQKTTPTLNNLFLQTQLVVAKWEIVEKTKSRINIELKRDKKQNKNKVFTVFLAKNENFIFYLHSGIYFLLVNRN
ncbi:MAG TPA: hypothetical protein VJZ05_03430 [Bacilli bacterium]|nr:hypothetical protein [Bacilli bacterium]